MKQANVITYERDAMNSYLVLQNNNDHTIQDYEVEMITRNAINALLDLHIQEVNGEARVYYNITSRQELITVLERKKLSHKDIYSFFCSLMEIIKDCSKYFLSSLKINLSPEYIYMNPHNFKPVFMYVPYADEAYDVQAGIRELIKLFFDKVDQDDVQGVMMIHRLYTAAKKDDFVIQQIESLMKQETSKYQKEQQGKRNSESFVKENSEGLNRKAMVKPVEKTSESKENKIVDPTMGKTYDNAHKKTKSENKKGNNLIQGEDSQVIDQLIQRNKQRQSMTKDQHPMQKTGAFSTKKRDKKQEKMRKKSLTYGDGEEACVQQDNKGISPTYLLIGCIQLVTIGLFLGLVKSGLLNNQVNGALRMDAVLASVVMLMALNLYVSKKIFEGAQSNKKGSLLRKHDKNHKMKNKSFINMHKEKVYNQPEGKSKRDMGSKLEQASKAYSHRSRDSKLERESQTLIHQPIEDDCRHQPNPFQHARVLEQIVDDQGAYDDSIESEDTTLLDEASLHIAREARPCLVQKNGDMVDKIMITNSPFIIGKLKEQVDHVISNSSVSRIHCKIIEKAGQYYMIDLNSKNGTYIDGEVLDSNREYPLHDGSKVTISNCIYTFEMN